MTVPARRERLPGVVDCDDCCCFQTLTCRSGRLLRPLVSNQRRGDFWELNHFRFVFSCWQGNGCVCFRSRHGNPSLLATLDDASGAIDHGPCAAPRWRRRRYWYVTPVGSKHVFSGARARVRSSCAGLDVPHAVSAEKCQPAPPAMPNVAISLFEPRPTRIPDRAAGRRWQALGVSFSVSRPRDFPLDLTFPDPDGLLL